jgi:peptide/nickel transport system substrate-binding protein
MRKKIVWILVSFFMVLSLVMASCGPAEEEAEVEVGEEEVKVEEEEVVEGEEEVVAAGPEVPKYGGTLNMMQSEDIQGYDHAMFPQGFLNNVFLVNDTLVVGDWTKGAAGTGEIDFSVSSLKRIDYTVGELAESFDVPEPGTVVFHIRKGVHFSLDPNSEASRLVNGREMTVDDVVFSLNRHIQSPMSYLRITQPTMPDSTTVTAEGDSVVIKTSIFDLDPLWLMIGEREIWPPEVIEKYGDVTEWQNQVGTGPFMMTDLVPGTSAYFERNDNYWQKDPIGTGKGNQLPYLDGIRILIISDTSSQLAALRTGKIDRLGDLSHDIWAQLTKTSPQLKYQKHVSGPWAISMRQDNPALPFSDKNVRHALMMGIDFQMIVDEYYEGDAEILAWPLAYAKGYDKAYMPLEEMPESVQELYSYKPEKAKQLLTDAGYPDGFTTKIICASVPAWVDYLSIIKDMWSLIDVDVSLELVEMGAFFNTLMRRQYDEMLYGFFVQPGPYAQLLPFQGSNTFNRSWVNDARVNETYNEILKYNLIDQAKVDQLHREIMPYVLGQAWYIPGVGQNLYTFWQPWLKNYHGEGLIGYKPSWIHYVWIDQDLK